MTEQHFLIHIEGMTCGGCASGIQRALSKDERVSSCQVDHVKKLADVVTTAEPDELRAKIEKLGYEVTRVDKAQG